MADHFAMHKADVRFSRVISSDLDCDRLDYLRRTALSSGAPYGSVDINFLIDQATVDTEGNFCFRSKAARAADHLLISRFYDYMQVPFNKTAVALEWSLVECLKAAFKENLIDPSGSSIEDRVRSGAEWHTFDDHFVFSIFRQLEGGLDGSALLDHLQAVSRRRPPKMLASWDILRAKNTSVEHDDLYSAHSDFRKKAEAGVRSFCQQEGIDSSRIFVWNKKVDFIKGDPLQWSNTEDAAYYAEGVFILENGASMAKQLSSREDMLICALGKSYMSGLRIYYLPHSTDDARDVSEIRQRLVRSLEGECGNPTII